MILEKKTLQGIYDLMGYTRRLKCCASCRYSREEEPDDMTESKDDMICKVNSFEIYVDREGVCRNYSEEEIKANDV